MSRIFARQFPAGNDNTTINIDNTTINNKNDKTIWVYSHSHKSWP